MVRIQNRVVNIRKKAEKAREDRLQPAETGKLSGEEEAPCFVSPWVTTIAMAGTSDSKFQLNVRKTFLLDLSKGECGGERQ